MEIMVLLLLVLAHTKNLFITTLYDYIDSLHFTVLILPGMLLLSAMQSPGIISSTPLQT